MGNDEDNGLDEFLNSALQMAILKFGDRISRVTFENAAGDLREALTVHIRPQPATAYVPLLNGKAIPVKLSDERMRDLISEMLDEQLKSKVPEIVANSQRRAM